MSQSKIYLQEEAAEAVVELALEAGEEEEAEVEEAVPQ